MHELRVGPPSRVPLDPGPGFYRDPCLRSMGQALAFTVTLIQGPVAQLLGQRARGGGSLGVAMGA